jgi:hypothetical protein
MSTSDAAGLVELINEKVSELKVLCKGIDEKTAASAPEGRWSPRQILSHVCGREGKGMIATIRPFLEQDMPRIDLEHEDPFFSEKRAKMTFAQLLAEVEKEYATIAALVIGLSAAQLHRKAHIPLLKDSPLGDYPTLAVWVQAIAGYHLDFHIQHMKEILQQLGKQHKE